MRPLRDEVRWTLSYYFGMYESCGISARILWFIKTHFSYIYLKSLETSPRLSKKEHFLQVLLFEKGSFCLSGEESIFGQLNNPAPRSVSIIRTIKGDR